MFLIVFTLLALHWTESIAIASLEGVSFNSTNLQNVVVWHSAMEGTRYSVEYAIYGDEDKTVRGQLLWRPVEHCTLVLRNSCDLSDQTHRTDEAYYARVRAVTDSGVASNWTVTKRFEPLVYTVLGPPRFTVHVSGNSLHINFKGPMRWKNKNMKKERPMKNVINDLWYNITVYDNTDRHTRPIVIKNQSYILGSLEYDTLYCISVRTFSRSFPLEGHTSERHCEKTPTDPFKKHMLLVILGGLLPSAISLFVLILVLCLVYHYIYGNKQKQPNNLTNMLSRDENVVPQMPTEVTSPSVHKTSILSVGDETVKPLLPPPSSKQEPRPPTYSPQQAADSAPPAYNSQSWGSQRAVSENHVPLNDEIQEVEEGELPPDYGLVVHSRPEESTGQGTNFARPPQSPAPSAGGPNRFMVQDIANPRQSANQRDPGDKIDNLPPAPWPTIRQPFLSSASQPSTEVQESRPPMYSPQQATNTAYSSQSWESSRAVSENHVPLNAEIQEIEEGDLPSDYGFVVHSRPEESTGQGTDIGRPTQSITAPPVTGHNHYMAQNSVSPRQSAYQTDLSDEDGPTLVDWNPTTGVLHIPELSSVPLREVRAEKETDMSMPRNIFSSLVVRQPSQESSDGLEKMETAWQLQINMDE